MAVNDLILQVPAFKFWFAIAVLAAVALAAFYLAFRRLRRARIIEDTPTAKIRSAPQGFIELEGLTEMLPGVPIYAPLSNRPCVWYEYTIERSDNLWHSRTRWVRIARERSDSIFALEDGTGRCVIDPEGAEVIPQSIQSWYGHDRTPGAVPPGQGAIAGPYRFTEKRIEAGTPLYVLGHFTTLGDSDGDSGLEADTRDLLARWKQNQQSLLKRFDLNRDGKIDAKEWAIVRKQAAKEALRERLEKPAEPTLNVLKKPPISHHPFILSALTEDRIVSRYRHSSWLTALVSLCCSGLIAWALNVRFQLL